MKSSENLDSGERIAKRGYLRQCFGVGRDGGQAQRPLELNSRAPITGQEGAIVAKPNRL